MAPSEPDGGSNPQLQALLDEWRAEDDAAEEETLGRLYGERVAWLPEPFFREVRFALLELRLAGLSSERIVALLAEERERANGPLIPPDGASPELPPYIKAIWVLLHAQRALELGEEGALEELAGTDAVIGKRMRKQRYTYSQIMTDGKKQLAARKRESWVSVGRPLRLANPALSDLKLAQMIAARTGDRVETIRPALKEIGLSKKK